MGRKLIGKMRLVLLLAFVFWGAPAIAQSVTQTGYDNTPKGGQLGQKVDSGTHPLPVSAAGSSAAPGVVFQKVTGTATYTKSSPILTGSSQQILAANLTRLGFVVYNPSTNGNFWIDISGGTIAIEGGTLIPPGSTFAITGSATPVTAITGIGTTSQTVIVQEGN